MRRPFNGTPVAITKTTTMKTILGWVQSGVCSLDWALMEYMELVETEIDGDVRKRLMANYNMLSTAKTTITSVSSTLYSTSGIGVTLLLLGSASGSRGDAWSAGAVRKARVSFSRSRATSIRCLFSLHQLRRLTWPQRRCVTQRLNASTVPPNTRLLR